MPLPGRKALREVKQNRENTDRQDPNDPPEDLHNDIVDVPYQLK